MNGSSRFLNVLRSLVVIAILALLTLLTGGPGVDAQDSNWILPGTYDTRPAETRPARRAQPRRVAPATATPAPAPIVEVEITSHVVVFGDSLAANLGQGLETVLADAPEIGVSTQSRPSSGLVRDDFHDWPAEVESFLAGDGKIDVAVVMIGLNDRQSMQIDGAALEPLSDPWREAYGARVDRIVQAFAEKRVPVLWVGLPPVQNGRLSTDLAAINELVRGRVRSGDGVFVDIWKGFVDEDNQYSATGPDLSGQSARLRASDGIHFTREGAAKAAHFADIEIRRLIERPDDEIAIARAAIEAADDERSREEAIDMLIRRSLGELPMAPGIVYAPSRPEIGPAVPLTRVDVSMNAALLTGRPALDPATRIITERALEDGVLIAPPPGRADDFRWPRSQ
ncbi:MAG: DUF459 domain-containing protein [Salinarimonadaceae bacterium]|nr:MAG: DUF459 domain-containing protein [Salinarimonadaceae bacterium]